MSKYEPDRVWQWLSTRLNGLAPGGAWRGVAPEGTAYPLITFNQQSSQDVAGVAGIRLWTALLVQVKAIAPANQSATLASIADSIDAAIHLQRNTAAGTDGVIVSCVREQTIAYEENAAGFVFSHMGGLYRIQVQAN